MDVLNIWKSLLIHCNGRKSYNFASYIGKTEWKPLKRRDLRRATKVQSRHRLKGKQIRNWWAHNFWAGLANLKLVESISFKKLLNFIQLKNLNDRYVNKNNKHWAFECNKLEMLKFKFGKQVLRLEIYTDL